MNNARWPEPTGSGEEIFPGPGTVHRAEARGPGETLENETLLRSVEAERDQYRDTLIQFKADFDNLRKRHDRTEQAARQAASETLIVQLLDVLDACDSAAIHGSTAVEPIASLLGEILRAHGLERIDPRPEDYFDPTVHIAVAHTLNPSYGDTLAVSCTHRPGYRMGSKLLRPAMVDVEGSP